MEFPFYHSHHPPTPITSITMSTISFTSSLSSNPLFSSIVTLYLLILLYFPYLFLHLFLSPIFISTLILLLSLLRLGVSQQIRVHNDPNSIQAGPSPEPKPTQHEAETEPHCIWAQTQQETDFDPEIKPEPEPKPTQHEAETKPHCIWVQTQQKTDFDLTTELEPEPIKDYEGREKFDHDPPEEKAETGLNLHQIETQSKTESGPEPEPEPIKDYEDREQFGHDPPEEKAETGLNLHQVEIQPKTESDPEPEPEPEREEPGEPFCNWVSTRPVKKPEPDPNPNPFSLEFFAKWDVGGPLEVIYEAYEGEEDVQNDAFEQENCKGKTERYPSLSRYYPESDSELDLDSGSDSDSSESLWGGEFKGIEEWDEDEREGLIEIALDYDGEKQGIKKLMEVVQFDDEDNLIEIDISPTIINHAFSW